MAGLKTIRDYFRDSSGAGINAATWVLKRLFDDSTLTSGSTAADAEPSVSLGGKLDVDETTLGGYPGPIKYTVTGSGSTRIHTSKSIGIVGSWRTVDVPRAWRSLGVGVQP